MSAYWCACGAGMLDHEANVLCNPCLGEGLMHAREEEREACAKLVEHWTGNTWANGEKVAAVIRARGKTCPENTDGHAWVVLGGPLVCQDCGARDT